MTAHVHRARRGHRLLAGAVVALAGLAAGCSAIPDAGPVHTVAVSPSDGGDDVLQYAQDPIPGGAPEVIVDGFVQAMGVGADEPSAFATANKFLTADAAADWKSSEVVIYQADTNPRFTQVADDRISITINVVGTLDAAGRYTESPPQPRTLLYRLAQVDGQWRISELPDVVVTSEPVFQRIYRLAPLYFPDTTMTSLVYEARYFARVRAAQSVVRALFEGPSAWLSAAVHNPVPAGATVGSVVVTQGVAEVNLGPAVQAASPKDRQLIAVEIETALRLVDVSQVRLLVNNQEFTIDRPLPTLTRSVASRPELYFVRGEELVSTVDDLAGAVPVAGVAKLAKQIASPAIRHDGSRIVALETPARLVQLLPSGTSPAVLLRGQALVAPSFDIRGWIWTAEPGTNQLTALASATDVVRLDAPWLAGRTITAIEPARDGVRVAIVVRENLGSSVHLVALTRDQAGRPLALGKPLRIAAGVASVTDVAWRDDGSIVAIGAFHATDPDEPLLLGAGSQTEELPTVPGAPVALAAGRYQLPSVLLVTDAGMCYALSDTRWEAEGTSIAYPTFSG